MGGKSLMSKIQHYAATPQCMSYLMSYQKIKCPNRKLGPKLLQTAVLPSNNNNTSNIGYFKFQLTFAFSVRVLCLG